MWEVIFSPCYALYLKNRNETKILRKLIYAAYEEGIVNNLMCQKWFANILVRERESAIIIYINVNVIFPFSADKIMVL